MQHLVSIYNSTIHADGSGRQRILRSQILRDQKPGSGKRPLLTKFAIPIQHIFVDLHLAMALLPPESDGQIVIPESISRDFPSEVVIQAPVHLNNGIEGANQDLGMTEQEFVIGESKPKFNPKHCF